MRRVYSCPGGHMQYENEHECTFGSIGSFGSSASGSSSFLSNDVGTTVEQI